MMLSVDKINPESTNMKNSGNDSGAAPTNPNITKTKKIKSKI